MLIQILQRIGIPAFLLLLGGAYFLEVAGGKTQDTMLIRPVFYLMAILFAVNALTDLREILHNHGRAGNEKEARSLRTTLLFCTAAVALVVLLPVAGFVLSAALFLHAVLRIFAVRNQNILYLMPIGVSIALYLLFEQGFSVPLPKGFLGF